MRDLHCIGLMDTVVAVLALCAVASLLGGCHEPAAPETPLRVEARVINPIVADGDRLAVRAVAINSTSRIVKVTSPSSCHFFIYIYDQSGEEVGSADPSCYHAETNLAVAADDSVFRVIYWGPRVSTDHPPATIPAGDYRVRAVLDVVGGSDYWSAPIQVSIR